MISFEIPLKLPSVANLREHWAVKAKRTKRQRETARAESFWGLKEIVFPANIKLVRVSPRLLDSDNLAACFKGTQDGIADALGMDDRDPRVTWEYGQEKGKASVRVEVTSR